MSVRTDHKATSGRGRTAVVATGLAAVLASIILTGALGAITTGLGDTTLGPDRDRGDSDAGSTTSLGSLDLDLPDSVAVGDPIPISIGGLTPGEPVRVTVDAGYGVRPLIVVPDSNRLDIEIPPINGPASGVAVVTAVSQHNVALANLYLIPGDAVDPVDAYLGPRTVVADGTRSVMIVTVPVDSFGNPVATNTTIDYTVTRPEATTVERQVAKTAHLLSWLEVDSGTTAGRTRVGAQVPQSNRRPTTAGERTFLEVAGSPGEHWLTVLDDATVADGSRLIRVRTSTLADRYGNILPDGTMVTLDATGAGGRRRINGQTNFGQAEFVYEAPSRPGLVKMTATASGVEGEPVIINFEPAVASLEAEIRPGSDEVAVVVGPVVSVGNAYVPEGTTATVTMTNSGGDKVTRQVDLVSGTGAVVFPSTVDTAKAVVEVLGSRLAVEGPVRSGPLISKALQAHGRGSQIPDSQIPDGSP